MNVKELVIVLVFGLIGWALCGAKMGIGMAVTTEENALIIHAIGALIIFAVLSFIYFTKFNYTTPLQTAAIFVGFVIAVDFFVVALLIMNSFEMFTSPLGTWIPFALIFMATYLTGRYAQKRG
jgi:phosphatidylserine synthase